MGLNDTVSADRIHIGFFGLRNAGKSSLVNAITGQSLCVVSDVPGTTTDPVKKAMELLPLGPVVIIDTPGLDDDQQTLGELRVQKAKQILATVNIAVLVVDATAPMQDTLHALEEEIRERKIPYVLVRNKADLLSDLPAPRENELYVSAQSGYGVEQLKERLAAFAKTVQSPRVLLRDLLQAGDTVVLVTPIDESAPKGRLILPQQMALRDILDAHASAIVCQPSELSGMLAALQMPPRMVVTDSQVFGAVAAIVPKNVPLTSFSILMARYKGDLLPLIQGASVLRTLRDGDRVLICEGCTHHRQCNDIGTVKMPGWIEQFSAAKPQYTFTSGGDFPQDLTPYRLIVHCGGCMLQETEMKRRLAAAAAAGIPTVNYGIAIAQMHGILARSLELFPDVLKLLN